MVRSGERDGAIWGERQLVFVTGGACVKKYLNGEIFSRLSAKKQHITLLLGVLFITFGCKICARVNEMTN